MGKNLYLCKICCFFCALSKTPWSCSKRASFEVANVPWCDAILPPFHAFIPAHHTSPSQRKNIIRYLFIYYGKKEYTENLERKTHPWLINWSVAFNHMICLSISLSNLPKFCLFTNSFYWPPQSIFLPSQRLCPSHQLSQLIWPQLAASRFSPSRLKR